MSGVFICYRRSPASSPVAGRLSDTLVAAFGKERVFMDVDTVEPGRDFVTAIENALAASKVLIALIDPEWLTAVDADGRNRLADPDDFVRLELTSALQGEQAVVPVLIGGARMPRRDELPEDLAPLVRRNALTLTHERWRTDIQPLLEMIRRGEDIAEPAEPDEPPESAERTLAKQSVRGAATWMTRAGYCSMFLPAPLVIAWYVLRGSGMGPLAGMAVMALLLFVFGFTQIRSGFALSQLESRRRVMRVAITSILIPTPWGILAGARVLLAMRRPEVRAAFACS